MMLSQVLKLNVVYCVYAKIQSSLLNKFKR